MTLPAFCWPHRQPVQLTPPCWRCLSGLATNRVTAPASRRASARAVRDFLAWLAMDGGPLTRGTVERYRARLLEDGRAPATVNQRLSAVRTLADAAAAEGFFDAAAAASVASTRGVSLQGHAGRQLAHRRPGPDAAGCPGYQHAPGPA